MNTKAAMELTSSWLEAHGQQAQANLALRHPLVKVLEEILSDTAATGIAQIDGSPQILGLEGDLLLVLNLAQSDDGQIREELQVLPLDPKPALHISGLAEPGSAEAAPDAELRRTRTWTLTPALGKPLTVETCEVVWALFPSDVRPDSGERLMRALAKRIGWPIDSPPPGP